MTGNNTEGLVPKGKQEIVSTAEQTVDGLVFTPDDGGRTGAAGRPFG